MESGDEEDKDFEIKKKEAQQKQEKPNGEEIGYQRAATALTPPLP